ncbi:UNVERIFIED_CONTAM: hypothetical protein FKN15_027100 [Acipenser sinensis]
MTDRRILRGCCPLPAAPCMSASQQPACSPVRRSSRLATRSSATPDIRDWTIPRHQHYLRSNNIPFKFAARVITIAQPVAFQLTPHPLPRLHKTLRLHLEDAKGGTFIASVNLRLIQQFLSIWIQRLFHSQERLLP